MLSRRYAEQRGEWLILSAKHGLLEPRQVIAPYNVFLGDLTSDDREKLITMVRDQLQQRGIKSVRLLGSEDYGSILRKAGVDVDEPLKGMKLFTRIKNLKAGRV